MIIDVRRSVWDFEEPVTVVRLGQVDEDSFEIVYCNHANATAETEVVQIDRVDQEDLVYNVNYMLCDKCGAIKRETDDWWDKAPLEGLR